MYPSKTQKIGRECLRDILILISVALVIGVYLILLTVMISKDGVFYIESARFILDPEFEILSSRPAGFELLILLAHQTWKALTGDLSLQHQIWLAQSVTLTCRLLSVIAIYFIGRLCIGRKSSLWGCLVLLFLPEPAHAASDVLREWPYLLFLSSSVLCLLVGARKKQTWYLPLVALFGGLGFLIRSESVQVMILAVIVAVLMFFKSSQSRERLKWIAGFILAIFCFALPILIYALFSGQITTEYLKHYPKHTQSAIIDTGPKQVDSLDLPATDAKPSESIVETSTTEAEKAPNLGGFGYELFQEMGEMMMWFFLPFWGLGIAFRLLKKDDPIIRCTVGIIILMGIGMILVRYWFKQPAISARWLLPIIAVTACYIYAGIGQVEKWFQSGKSDKSKNTKLALILILIGIMLCLPKLLKPAGADKKYYRDAANWITANTNENDWFYTFDRRILFYAGRPYRVYDEGIGLVNPYYTEYLITPAKSNQPTIDLPEDAVFEISFSQEEKEILIYRREKVDNPG